MNTDSLYNHYKWYGPQNPLKKFQKNPPTKIHDEAVQSNILWLNLNKIGEISILQSAHKQGNPSFHFHAPGSKRRYPCTQTASAVPKYFPCLLQIRTGYRIWHASRVWKRKTSEKRWSTHSKKYPYATNAFSLFLDEFLEIDLRPIYCSLTSATSRTLDPHYDIIGWERSSSASKYFHCVLEA